MKPSLKKKWPIFFFRRFWLEELRLSEKKFVRKRYTLIPLPYNTCLAQGCTSMVRKLRTKTAATTSSPVYGSPKSIALPTALVSTRPSRGRGGLLSAHNVAQGSVCYFIVLPCVSHSPHHLNAFFSTGNPFLFGGKRLGISIGRGLGGLERG